MSPSTHAAAQKARGLAKQNWSPCPLDSCEEEKITVNCIFQRFPWPKFGHFGRLDVDNGTGARIASRASGVLAHCKRVEASECNAAALL